MRILGIRAEPRKIYITILDTELKEVINLEAINVPLSLDMPGQLKYIRNTTLDIIREYNVEKAGIRLAEGNSQTIKIERIYTEAVIQEAFSSSPVESYFTGRKKSISSRLGITTKQFDSYVRGQEGCDLVEGWPAKGNAAKKESILVALGAYVC
ncbi:hypothetical protein ACN06F_09220 [Vreelandella sp. 21]|uniref:hypothetical protein n=1 Tax=Vreelandella sp. 21 TaxID=3402864 RepID=UPI003D9AA066